MIRLTAISLLAVAAIAPSPASAHLLPEQTATLKIVDNSANFVISVPVTAFHDVDKDGDGLLSSVELDIGRDAIRAQFADGFDVSSNGETGRRALTMVMSPQTDDPNAPTSYVIVMQRVFFHDAPRLPRVVFDLFGTQAGEKSLSFRATLNDEIETATLTQQNSGYTFFQNSSSAQSELAGQTDAGWAGGFGGNWQIGALLAVILAGILTGVAAGFGRLRGRFGRA